MSKEIECDVLVVGSGAAGLATAITASTAYTVTLTTPLGCSTTRTVTVTATQPGNEKGPVPADEPFWVSSESLRISYR